MARKKETGWRQGDKVVEGKRQVRDREMRDKKEREKMETGR